MLWKNLLSRHVPRRAIVPIKQIFRFIRREIMWNKGEGYAEDDEGPDLAPKRFGVLWKYVEEQNSEP